MWTSTRGTLRVRRSAGMVRIAGESADVVEGDTKSGKPRVVDMDAETVAVLRAGRKQRGSMALQLVRDDALVFGDLEGGHRNPEHTSRQFVAELARCRRDLGRDDEGPAGVTALAPGSGPAGSPTAAKPPGRRAARDPPA